VAVGASVALDGSASSAVPGRTIAACRWSIASGASIAAFSGATDQCTSAVVATLAAGGFSAVLTVTDSAGAQATASVAITVEATAAASGAGSSASGGSSTGGGASGGLGLVALAAAAGLLARRRADRA
jgi:hypothetical protein